MPHHSNRTRCPRALGVFFVLLSGLLLSACATRPAISPPVSIEQRAAEWQAQRRALAQLERWSFSGRVAVKDKQSDSWSAALAWQQRGDSYDIRLSGAFGRQAARLFGRPGYAVIETGAQAALSASSVEMLMQEQLGWSVPVQGFKHWLVGAPAPGMIDRYALDAAGRLAELQQSGWQIRYSRYQRVADLDLPRKLELENPRLRIRLVIDDWDLARGDADDVV
ncbi:hypothetical protein Tel_15185 [Candidatus Tenderia electrophaga]|jgi:outer membrane lipoprotein LolB|uniref:Outer-membrane lipoprotein LolB n=1 Tax=Candidatus Tenderia electrophaga TaxID=1748243 RepID=A0A0S2TGV8_9GAMM|nr:hypothetical protein Tel_15185 [Candidatus Tenderia electrophaga]